MKNILNLELTVGVLSDTHLPYRLPVLPDRVLQIFAGVDVIVHAGDVDQIAMLHPLSTIAPLYAVRGNVHLGDLSWGGRELPHEIHLTLANRQVVVTHGHRRGMIGGLLKLPEILQSFFIHKGATYLNEQIVCRLQKTYPQADVVIFGHTHKAYSKTIGNTLFFNPGAVAPTQLKIPSVGLLYFAPDKVTTKIVRLSPGDFANQR